MICELCDAPVDEPGLCDDCLMSCSDTIRQLEELFATWTPTPRRPTVDVIDERGRL